MNHSLSEKARDFIHRIRQSNIECFGVLVMDDLGWMYEEELQGKIIVDETALRAAIARDFKKGAMGDHMAYQRCVIYREVLGELE